MKGWLSSTLALVVSCGGGSGASSNVDAGAAADGASDAASEPEADTLPPPPSVQGVIALGEIYMTTMGMWMVGAGADFYGPEDFTVPSPVETFGACAVYEGASSGGNTGKTLDAGTIAVTGGARDVEMERGAGGYGADVPQTASNLFSDGDALHVEAKGGADVPAFAGDLDAPPALDVNEPCLACGLDVDREADFTLAWEPNEGTDIFLELTAGDVVVACGANDTDGGITVPAAALAYLPATFDGGMLMLTRTGRASITAGPAFVSFEAATTACSMGRIR
jgi:hypothetical protein